MSSFDKDLDDLLNGKATLEEILARNSTLKETTMENGLNNTQPKKQQRYAGLEAELLIGVKMREVCAKTSDNTARYQIGWDDDRLVDFAKANGFAHIHEGHIKHIRKTLFGPLYNKVANGKGAPRMTRIANLEKDLTDVMSYLTSKNPHWRTQI